MEQPREARPRGRLRNNITNEDRLDLTAQSMNLLSPLQLAIPDSPETDFAFPFVPSPVAGDTVQTAKPQCRASNLDGPQLKARESALEPISENMMSLRDSKGKLSLRPSSLKPICEVPEAEENADALGEGPEPAAADSPVFGMSLPPQPMAWSTRDSRRQSTMLFRNFEATISGSAGLLGDEEISAFALPLRALGDPPLLPAQAPPSRPPVAKHFAAAARGPTRGQLADPASSAAQTATAATNSLGPPHGLDAPSRSEGLPSEAAVVPAPSASHQQAKTAAASAALSASPELPSSIITPPVSRVSKAQLASFPLDVSLSFDAIMESRGVAAEKAAPAGAQAAGPKAYDSPAFAFPEREPSFHPAQLTWPGAEDGDSDQWDELDERDPVRADEPEVITAEIATRQPDHPQAAVHEQQSTLTAQPIESTASAASPGEGPRGNGQAPEDGAAAETGQEGSAAAVSEPTTAAADAVPLQELRPAVRPMEEITAQLQATARPEEETPAGASVPQPPATSELPSQPSAPAVQSAAVTAAPLASHRVVDAVEADEAGAESEGPAQQFPGFAGTAAAAYPAANPTGSATQAMTQGDYPASDSPKGAAILSASPLHASEVQWPEDKAEEPAAAQESGASLGSLLGSSGLQGRGAAGGTGGGGGSIRFPALGLGSIPEEEAEMPEPELLSPVPVAAAGSLSPMPQEGTLSSGRRRRVEGAPPGPLVRDSMMLFLQLEAAIDGTAGVDAEEVLMLEQVREDQQEGEADAPSEGPAAATPSPAATAPAEPAPSSPSAPIRTISPDKTPTMRRKPSSASPELKPIPARLSGTTGGMRPPTVLPARRSPATGTRAAPQTEGTTTPPPSKKTTSGIPSPAARPSPLRVSHSLGRPSSPAAASGTGSPMRASCPASPARSLGPSPRTERVSLVARQSTGAAAARPAASTSETRPASPALVAKIAAAKRAAASVAAGQPQSKLRAPATVAGAAAKPADARPAGASLLKSRLPSAASRFLPSASRTAAAAAASRLPGTAAAASATGSASGGAKAGAVTGPGGAPAAPRAGATGAAAKVSGVPRKAVGATIRPGADKRPKTGLSQAAAAPAAARSTTQAPAPEAAATSAAPASGEPIPSAAAAALQARAAAAGRRPPLRPGSAGKKGLTPPKGAYSFEDYETDPALAFSGRSQLANSPAQGAKDAKAEARRLNPEQKHMQEYFSSSGV